MTGGTGGGGTGGRTPGSHGRGPSGRTRILLAGATAAIVVIAGAAYALLHSGSGSGGSGGTSAPVAPAPVRVLRIDSLAPASGSAGVNGAAPILISFNGPLKAGSPSPVITPAVPGTWRHLGDDDMFTPAVPLPPDRRFEITVPAGMRAVGGAALRSPATARFTTAGYSQLRLSQLLAQLGYLPMTWTPASGPQGRAADEDSSFTAQSQVALAYNPPAGTFTFEAGYPSWLTSQWVAGQPNALLRGAVIAFRHEHGMSPIADIGPAFWAALFKAAAGNELNPAGYNYALASKVLPESLTIWHNGSEVFHSLANTGIPASPTVDGTFPVYDKLPFQIMQGTNPDGSHYADPVEWVSYFNGGDAVHYFPRPGYGYQQSLGCVELPWSTAHAAYPWLTYGTLVTVGTVVS